MADPLPKYARVSTQNPEAWAVCDRCGFWYNRSDLVWQTGWAGQHLYSLGILVCTTGNRCFDIPNEQLRTIILPPDPPPIINARVPNYAYEEQLPLIAQQGGTSKVTYPNDQPPWGAGPQLLLCDQSGEVALLAQYTQDS